ncbi:hypothetical protein [Treponema primitia]|uniref:hypothetical protein n=1 Tax=Treponema primitia TaxID=88058 RepID=UPI00025553FA|nr:hypothetical protein [Treponema primitia]
MNERAKKRQALLLAMDTYLEALIDKKPENAPVSPKLKMTNNGETVKIGDTQIWKNTLLIKERQTFADPDTGEAVFFGTFTNMLSDNSVTRYIPQQLYAFWATVIIRIKVENSLIIELEELVNDRQLRGFPALKKDIVLPDPNFGWYVPEGERSTKEEMIALIDNYWDCASGLKPIEKLPAHPDVQRFEEGYRTTNHLHSFRGDFKHNTTFRWDVLQENRRYPVVDPEHGTIVSYCMMENNVADPQTREFKRGALVVEAFRIECGLIYRLLAMFPFLDDKIGW